MSESMASAFAPATKAKRVRTRAEPTLIVHNKIPPRKPAPFALRLKRTDDPDEPHTIPEEKFTERVMQPRDSIGMKRGERMIKKYTVLDELQAKLEEQGRPIQKHGKKPGTSQSCTAVTPGGDGIGELPLSRQDNAGNRLISQLRSKRSSTAPVDDKKAEGVGRPEKTMDLSGFEVGRTSPGPERMSGKGEGSGEMLMLGNSARLENKQATPQQNTRGSSGSGAGDALGESIERKRYSPGGLTVKFTGNIESDDEISVDYQNDFDGGAINSGWSAQETPLQLRRAPPKTPPVQDRSGSSVKGNFPQILITPGHQQTLRGFHNSQGSDAEQPMPPRTPRKGSSDMQGSFRSSRLSSAGDPSAPPKPIVKEVKWESDLVVSGEGRQASSDEGAPRCGDHIERATSSRQRGSPIAEMPPPEEETFHLTHVDVEINPLELSDGESRSNSAAAITPDLPDREGNKMLDGRTDESPLETELPTDRLLAVPIVQKQDGKLERLLDCDDQNFLSHWYREWDGVIKKNQELLEYAQKRPFQNTRKIPVLCNSYPADLNLSSRRKRRVTKTRKPNTSPPMFGEFHTTFPKLVGGPPPRPPSLDDDDDSEEEDSIDMEMQAKIEEEEQQKKIVYPPKCMYCGETLNENGSSLKKDRMRSFSNLRPIRESPDRERESELMYERQPVTVDQILDEVDSSFKGASVQIPSQLFEVIRHKQDSQMSQSSGKKGRFRIVHPGPSHVCGSRRYAEKRRNSHRMAQDILSRWGNGRAELVIDMSRKTIMGSNDETEFTSAPQFKPTRLPKLSTVNPYHSDGHNFPPSTP